MKKLSTGIILTLLFHLQICSQNLLLNPGFEDTLCQDHPVAPVPLHVKNWYSPSAGTPDLYTAGSQEAECAISNIYDSWWSDFGEWQFPHEGNNMAGIYTYLEEFCVREYLQGKLNTPLQAGSKYCVSYWVSLSNQSLRAHDRLGAYLSADSLINFNSTCIFDVNPQIQTPPGMVFADTSNWMLVTSDFVAQGGEQFIMIGNFFENDELTAYEVNGNGGIQTAYYFIDDVKVEICEETSDVLKYQTESILFFPNPVNDILTLQPVSLSDYYIRNAEGNIVMQILQQSNTVQVNIADLAQGYYFIEVYEQGKLIHRNKLIKINY